MQVKKHSSSGVSTLVVGKQRHQTERAHVWEIRLQYVSTGSSVQRYFSRGKLINVNVAFHGNDKSSISLLKGSGSIQAGAIVLIHSSGQSRKSGN